MKVVSNRHTGIYIGSLVDGSTSRHKLHALERVGCSMLAIDPRLGVPQLGETVRGRFHYYTGYRFLDREVSEYVRNALARIQDERYARPSFVWVDSGEIIGESTIALLKKLDVPIVLYNHDDPTGPRDRARFATLRRTLPMYDLCIAVRRESEEEFINLGARVKLVDRTFDEVAHAPLPETSPLLSNFSSEVAFVGTWIRGEERDDFLWRLISRGVNLSIWGDRWERSPAWRHIRKNYRGPALKGKEYVAALQASKVALGLLSSLNRDKHTTRSLEIPYLRGLLCAERTVDHERMLRDQVEALYWNDAYECEMRIKWALRNSDACRDIRNAARDRVIATGHGNESLARNTLHQIGLDI